MIAPRRLARVTLRFEFEDGDAISADIGCDPQGIDYGVFQQWGAVREHLGENVDRLTAVAHALCDS